MFGMRYFFHKIVIIRPHLLYHAKNLSIPYFETSQYCNECLSPHLSLFVRKMKQTQILLSQNLLNISPSMSKFLTFYAWILRNSFRWKCLISGNMRKIYL